MHDPDACFCGEDFTGQCPCPCSACRARSVDPVEFARQQAGAKTLITWMEMLDDHQWKAFERWLILHGPEAAPFFPPFVLQRQIAFADDYPTMRASQKAKYDCEWEILSEFEAADALADQMCAFRKQHAAKRYLARMRKLREHQPRRQIA